MAIPKQIQQQLEEAERIEQQLAAGAPANEDTPADPPPAEPPAEPPVAAAPEPTPPAEPVDEWRQRYDTLRGKYDAETGRLHETLRQTTAQLTALQQQVTQLTQRPPEPPKAPEQPLVTGQDDEKFGSDLIDVMRRAAQEQLRPLMQRLESLESLAKSIGAKASRVEQVEQEVVQSRQERFYSELTSAVPNWEEVNKDQRWLQWLAEKDPILGKTRQAALDEASSVLDHPRVAAMFKLFISQVMPPTPPTQQAKTELARQVAPAKSSKTTVQPQGAKVYTGRDYHHWLDPRRVHDTDNAKLQAMIAELERAYVENRIQW